MNNSLTVCVVDVLGMKPYWGCVWYCAHFTFMD